MRFRALNGQPEVSLELEQHDNGEVSLIAIGGGREREIIRFKDGVALAVSGGAMKGLKTNSIGQILIEIVPDA